MNHYIILISYTRASAEDFCNLDHKLIRIGCHKTIRDQQGLSYSLPQGTYYYSDETISTVALCERIRTYAQERSGCEIFVCDIKQWSGNLPSCSYADITEGCK